MYNKGLIKSRAGWVGAFENVRAKNHITLALMNMNLVYFSWFTFHPTTPHLTFVPDDIVLKRAFPCARPFRSLTIYIGRS